MTVMERDNKTTTTDAYTAATTVADQRSPTTRRVSLDLSSEVETSRIEQNVEFHATIVRRRQTQGPTVDATEVLPDL